MPALSVLSNAGDIAGASFGILTNRVVIEMDDTIHLLEQSASPLTTMLTHPDLQTTPARSPKVEWLEDQILPRVIAAAGAFTNVATTINVAAGYGAYLRAGDIVRDDLTGENFVVQSMATDAITAVRGVGNAGVGIASSGAADTLIRVSNTSQEGATLGTIKMTQPVAQFNYSQIFRYPYGFTGTAQATNTYGGSLLDFERQKKGIEIKRDLEQTLFLGKRDINTALGSNIHAVRFMGGLLSFLVTNVTTLGAALTLTAWETFLRGAMRYNSTADNCVVFVSPFVASVISAAGSGTGMGYAQRLAPPQAGDLQWGVKVSRYMSSTTGISLPIITKQDWNDLGTASPGLNGTAVFVNMDNIRVRQLQGRTISVLENRQGNDEDARKDEWFVETSCQVIQEPTHAILRGITG